MCKVRIVAGKYHATKMSPQHVTREDEANGFVLACRTLPHSDICLTVEGKMIKRFQPHRFGTHASRAPAGIGAYLSSSSSSPKED